MVRYSSPQRKCLSTYFLRPRTTTVSGTVTVTATAADSSRQQRYRQCAVPGGQLKFGRCRYYITLFTILEHDDGS
jgi:hypothetical protein